MGMNGARENQQRMLFSALTNIPGKSYAMATSFTILADTKSCSYGGYSSDGWGHGVRNIVFSTPYPSVGPESWIRLEHGETRARVRLDENYP